jgi:hypothetical protein
VHDRLRVLCDGGRRRVYGTGPIRAISGLPAPFTVTLGSASVAPTVVDLDTTQIGGRRGVNFSKTMAVGQTYFGELLLGPPMSPSALRVPIQITRN